MTDSYIRTPAEELDDTLKDLYVAAVTAKRGRLNTGSADRLVARLRGHADRMVFPGDAGLLHEAAGKLEAVSMRVKAQADRGRRVKAAPTRPAPPSEAELVRQFDAMTMGNIGGGSSEAAERQRAVHENRRLAELNRRSEEERRRQVGEEPEERPWWR